MERRALQCAELLLKYGADVNGMDSNGITALYWTSQTSPHRSYCMKGNSRQKPMVKLLLSSGAQVNMLKTKCDPKFQVWDEQTVSLLHAAGERDVKMAKQFGGTELFRPPDWEDLGLMNQCRKFIRKHLLTLDPNTNLFIRVPQLHVTKLDTPKPNPGLLKSSLSALLSFLFPRFGVLERIISFLFPRGSVLRRAEPTPVLPKCLVSFLLYEQNLEKDSSSDDATDSESVGCCSDLDDTDEDEHNFW